MFLFDWKNVLNHKILVRKNVEYTIDLIEKMW